MEKTWGFHDEWSPSEVPRPKTLGPAATRFLAFRYPFTMIPPRLFHTLSQYLPTACPSTLLYHTQSPGSFFFFFFFKFLMPLQTQSSFPFSTIAGFQRGNFFFFFFFFKVLTVQFSYTLPPLFPPKHSSGNESACLCSCFFQYFFFLVVCFQVLTVQCLPADCTLYSPNSGL